jgi:uncharacterized protein (DUF885 family)
MGGVTDLDALAADYWDAYLERHPTFATAIGDRRFDDRLEDESPEGREAWSATLDELERRLAEVPGDGDPVTAAALREQIATDRAFLEADLGAFNVDPMDGPQVELLNIASYQPIRTPEEAGALLAELALPGDRVLVKGSRSAGLEAVAETLQELLGRGGTA